MNIKGWYFLLMTCLIMSSCTNEPNIKKTKTHTTEHPYPTDPVVEPTKAIPSTESMSKLEREKYLYMLYRDLWQNPIEVMQKIGDLEGKTVADIGAGPYGYFSIQLAAYSKVAKVLALDIDTSAINFIENVKKRFPDKEIGDKIETRQVEPDDPKLKKDEADIILIVNTAPYFSNRVSYFKNLMNGLAPNGKVVVIDFKKRYTEGAGPPIDSRIALGEMEQDLATAGYTRIKSDDRTLEYQYIIIARE